MPKTEIKKKSILITIDKELANHLRKYNLKVSTLINHLLWKHLAQKNINSEKM